MRSHTPDTRWPMDQIPSSFRLKAKSSSISVFLHLDLLPRKHRRVDFKAKKDNLTLRYLITSSYFSPFFVLSFSASDLWYLAHSNPITPVVVKISGVKEPCSTCITRRLYWRFFSCSWWVRMVFIWVFFWLSLLMFVTRTSKKAFCPCLQNPRARIGPVVVSLVTGLDSLQGWFTLYIKTNNDGFTDGFTITTSIIIATRNFTTTSIATAHF